MRYHVSAVVLAWNGRTYLSSCIDSLQIQLSDADELILVDNGSTDGAPQQLAAERPQIRLIRNHKNLGVAGGFNQGVEAANGDIIILVNQDVSLYAQCIDSLLRQFSNNSRVGVLGCKLLCPDRQTLQHVGAFIRLPSGDPVQIGRWQKETGQYRQPVKVDYVTAAVAAFPKNVWNAVGGFDERFYPAYYEDADFCFRVRRAGYDVLCVPEAVAIHYEATSVGRLSCQHYFVHHSSRLHFVFKYLSSQQIAKEFLTEELARLDLNFCENEARALEKVYNLREQYVSREAGKAKAINKVLRVLCTRITLGLSVVTDEEVATRLILQ